MDEADLVFFCAKSSMGESLHSANNINGFTTAVKKVRGGHGVFHVSVPLSNIDVVHAVPKKGVLRETLVDFCNREKVDLATRHEFLVVMFCRIEGMSDMDRIRARTIASQKVGCEYNDIFNETCLNSRNREAYYCCQLVRKCFPDVFTVGTLNFMDAETGTIADYWQAYYRELGVLSVPQGQPGSHPGDLFISDRVRIIREVVVE